MNLRSVNMGLTSGDLDKIKNIVKTIFTEDFLQNVAESVVKIVSEKFEKRMDDQDKRINSMAQEISDLKKNNLSFTRALDNCEQASRNLNIRIFGMPEGENEDLRKEILGIFTKKMKVNVRDLDIKKCHRVKSKTPGGKPSAVLVRFDSDNARVAVLQNRKNLRDTGIQIKEDLTKYKLDLLKKAVEKFSSKCAWCLNGNIYIKRGNDVTRVDSEDDFLSII